MTDLATQAAAITVDDIFRRAFRIYADRVAVTSETGQWTYGELGERVERLAGALAAMGLGHGDRLTVLSETRPEYIEVYAAAARLGVTVVALNIRLHPDELLYCTNVARPSLLFSTDAFATSAKALQDAPSVRTTISFDDAGSGGYASLLAGAESLRPVSSPGPEDIHNGPCSDG